MNTENEYFPHFRYPAGDIIKYNHADGVFTMLLTNDQVEHFVPIDADTETAFFRWLQTHHVPDLEMEARLLGHH